MKFILALLVEKDHRPRPCLIQADSPQILDYIVDGEAIHHRYWDDDVLLISCKSAKVSPETLNRVIMEEGTHLVHTVVFGPFLLCSGKKNALTSLSPAMFEKYLEKFFVPDRVITDSNGVVHLEHYEKRND